MRRAPRVAPILGIALLLAACASDAGSDSPTTTTTTAAPTTTATPTSEAPTTTTTTVPGATTTTLLAPSCGTMVEVDNIDAGTQRTDSCDVPQVWVPAGTFVQGTSDVEGLDPPNWAAQELRSEQPAHEVTITQGFWMDLTEVTNGTYAAFVEAGGYGDPQHWSEDGWRWRLRQTDLPVDCGGAEDDPRVCVTWYEAEAYASWRGGRLPTESEWEYAARGPGSPIYPWGDRWDPSLANVTELDTLVPVGSYPGGASWVGLLDMAGNAMEWVQDWMSYSYYTDEPQTDPQGPDGGTTKIEKGGWWGSNPYVARSAYRHFEDPPSYEDHHIGFRVLTPTS